MPDIGRHCLANTALVLLSNYLTTCQLSAGCSVADNPGLWLDSDPAVRYAAMLSAGQVCDWSHAEPFRIHLRGGSSMYGWQPHRLALRRAEKSRASANANVFAVEHLCDLLPWVFSLCLLRKGWSTC